MPRPLTDAAGYRKILLRIPGDLLDEAKACARIEDRSLNAQLVQFIRQALRLWENERTFHSNLSAP